MANKNTINFLPPEEESSSEYDNESQASLEDIFIGDLEAKKEPEKKDLF